MGAPATLRLKVRHYEVDEYGHVNHANYVHYLETARVEALEAIGLPLREMRRQGLIIVAADLSVKYHSPAAAGETLDVVTRIREMRGARTFWVQEIREANGQRLVVTAEVTGAFMTEAGRPLRAPDAFREKLSALYAPDGDRVTVASDTAPHPREPGGSVADRSVVGVSRCGAASHDARTWCLCRGGGLREALRNIVRVLR